MVFSITDEQGKKIEKLYNRKYLIDCICHFDINYFDKLLEISKEFFLEISKMEYEFKIKNSKIDYRSPCSIIGVSVGKVIEEIDFSKEDYYEDYFNLAVKSGVIQGLLKDFIPSDDKILYLDYLNMMSKVTKEMSSLIHKYISKGSKEKSYLNLIGIKYVLGGSNEDNKFDRGTGKYYTKLKL